jgi:hypothetical protein
MRKLLVGFIQLAANSLWCANSSYCLRVHEGILIELGMGGVTGTNWTQT